jgi:hypothetical protein
MALSNYEDLGFNQFLERSIVNQGTSTTMTSSDVNFDNAQISGSLGDRIQVGGSNIIIDGTNRKISILDDNGNEAIIIGDVT